MSAITSGADTASKSEQAKQAMSTATDKAGSVASEASEQVRNVTHEAKQQAQELADRARQDLREQAQQRSQHAAETMRTFAQRLGSLAEGNSAEAGPLVDYLREGQYRINEWAGRLDDGPDALFDELRSFARRKPMMFLASAGVLGFMTGRLVRSGSGANESNGSTGTSGGPALPMPPASAPSAPSAAPGTMPASVSSAAPGTMPPPPASPLGESSNGMPG